MGIYEHFLADTQGEKRWIRWQVRALFDQDKQVVEYQSVGRDITEAKNLELGLQKAKKSLEWQAEKRTRIMKQVAFQLLEEKPVTDTLNFICQELVSLYDCSLVWIGFKERNGAISLKAQAGSTYGFLSQGSIPLKVEGEILGVMGLYSKEANYFTPEILSQLEEWAQQVAIVLKAAKNQKELQLLNTALESATNTVVLTDETGIIQWHNSTFAKLTGYSQLVGKNIRLLRSYQHSDSFYRQLERILLAGKIWSGEIINQDSNGSFYIQEITITPIKDEQGRISNFLSVGQDITGKRRMEEQVLRAKEQLSKGEKLSSLGAMAGCLAHEINQPLNSLKIIADSILYWNQQEERLDSKELLADIKKISGQADRISQIVQRIREFFSQHNSSKLFPCNLVQAMEKAVDLMGQQVSFYGIEIYWELPGNLPLVLSTPIWLEIIITNLLRNASQALRTTRGKKQITIRAWVKERVVLEISDNGPGIRPELLEKIFEPFSSTKESGMGIGLSLVHSLVTAGGGKISCLRNEQNGATFRLEFVLVED